MAKALGNRYGFSRKPNPLQVSTKIFDEDAIRADLRETMVLAKEHCCSVEFVMKDVHTLSDEPDRLTRWVKLGREVSAEIYASQ